MLVKIHKSIYYLIILFIFVAALYLRSYAYIQFRPLWHDECSLAINILNKNFLDFFSNLSHEQYAPPLFMIFTKILTLIFGMKEAVFRFLPFIFSIFSIPLFYIFSKKFLERKISIITANLLFCINYYLIYYSQEFKQYSSDVLVFLLIFIIISKINFKKTPDKKIILSGFLLSLLSLFSFSSLFIIGAFILVELLSNKNNTKPVLKFSIPVCFAFIFYFLSIILQSKNNFILNYWDKGFLSFNFSKIIVFIQTNLQYYFYPNKTILFILILIVTGFFIIAKNYKNKNNMYLITICIFAISASILKLYPIFQRVSLYLIPILIILLIKPLDIISRKKKTLSVTLILLIFFSLKAYNFSYLYKIKSLSNRNYDARTITKKLYENYKDDLIIINRASDSEFLYYSKYYDFKTDNFIFIETPNNDKNLYMQTLNSIPKNQKVWFYYINDYSHSPVIFILKEWIQDKEILYQYEKNGSCIFHINL